MNIDKTIGELSQNEKKVMLTLKKLKGKASPQDILKNGDFQQKVEVMNASSWLQSKKLVRIVDRIKTAYSLGKEGEQFLKKGFPEKRALSLIDKKGGKLPLEDLSKILERNEIPIAVGWLRKKTWANIINDGKKTYLQITREGEKAIAESTKEEKLLKEISKKGEIVESNYLNYRNELKQLLIRKNVLKQRDSIDSIICLTENGNKLLQKGFEITNEISQITDSIIKEYYPGGSAWNKPIGQESFKIRPYDINAFAPATYGGKAHPLVDLIIKIRQIFLEMGFQEIEGNFVESCFWNMDMLFIPQDHPAREMQDTLYCKNPSKIKIGEKDLVEKIAKVHEDGGNTSSTGWGHTFSKTEGERALLRTHATVNTIRYLYHNPKPPCKIFSIGRVFRKENIDATHLPEFYQIEGIVHEEGTNFKQLIGVLKEFYRRMGFEKIRFRPAYFPYTEPSMEVEVFWNNEWMELGGSGVFRPEVTEPIGIKNLVLAWGLGLERLAMLKFELTDIRDLYISDLDWLRKKSLL